MDIAVTLHGIGKSYGKKTLYHNFQAKFDRPGCYFITGGNGSGKSTLLKIIGRLLEPDSGSVDATVGGAALERDVYRALIGMVSPEIRFYDALTADENIAFLASLRNPVLSRKAIADNLRAVGLEPGRGLSVGAFSTGMKQRLKFALLISSGARVWLLDEPSSNLDEAGKSMAAVLAREAARQGRLVVWATNEEKEVCDAAAVYRLDGCEKYIAEGNPC